MSIVVVGINHRSAPIELLERLSIADIELPKALHQLMTYEHVLEGAVLSTCNRVEVYALVSKFHGGAQDLKNFLAEFRHVAPEDFVDVAYTYHDDAAVRQLFRVASGIDSLVVGESEILGQVRRAFQTAKDEGAVQRVLLSAGRYAHRVGKRARTETAIGRNPVSVSSAAVELARRAFEEGLSGKQIAVVGAGKMGNLAARALRQAGATDVVVVNRSEERAQRLAEEFSARSRSLEDLPQVLTNVDIVICSTTAPQTIVERDVVAKVMERRDGRTLLIVDIAVPRDVEPSVAELEGVVLRDIDDLKSVVETSVGSRLAEVVKVEGIIDEELDRFLAWERSTDAEPTIAEIIARAEEVRDGDVLLRISIDRLRELASSKQANRYTATLRELLGLDDEPEA